jgi:hypothetical protein
VEELDDENMQHQLVDLVEAGVLACLPAVGPGGMEARAGRHVAWVVVVAACGPEQVLPLSLSPTGKHVTYLCAPPTISPTSQ